MNRYLARYAQPEVATLPATGGRQYANVLVIPCYDEAVDFLHTLLPTSASDLLVIVVPNAPDNAPADARGRTLALLNALREGATNPLNIVPFARSRNVDLLIVDRVSDGRLIPHRQGVGLARKIGADCALALIATGVIEGEWIHATDADVVLPDDYFHVELPESAVALFPFHHQSPDADLQARAGLYELHLRYYVNRLANAGSPYAFHTLGSTMAIHALAYAQVRGYPRRNAGEDFYLLNKLAKVGAVHRLPAPRITIQARPSQRVPFGTGPALTKIPDHAADYVSYAAASFDLLRDVLCGISAVSAGKSWRSSPRADVVLADLGFFESLHNVELQQRSADTRRKAMHQWFDGFRTLRFIHECRRFHGDRPLLATLAELFGPGPPATDALCAHYLRQLRAIETAAPLGLQ